MVQKRLTETHTIDPARVELLTGTQRGYERDELVKKHVLEHLLRVKEPEKPLDASVYLVSTSAGEVGAPCGRWAPRSSETR